MFGLLNRNQSTSAELTELRDRGAYLELLELDVQQLKIQLDEANRKIESILNQTAAAEPVIDFDSARVFSIERGVVDGKPCTTLGMWVNDPVLSSDGHVVVKRDKSYEWLLFCDENRHAGLVNQFKLWKEAQRG